MSEHVKRGQGNMPKKGQGQRVGTAALIAAASLLGSSLGVAAVGSGEPVGPGANSAGQNAVEISSGGPENMRLAAVKVPVVTPPHISIKTNQVKTFEVEDHPHTNIVNPAKTTNTTNQVKTTNNTNHLKTISWKGSPLK